MTKYRKHIAAYIVEIPKFFTHALTSNSCNRTLPNYHTDHINSGGPPTARTHKISTNSGRFPCSSTKFPFKHTHTPTPRQKSLVAKYERMKDQSN